MMLSYSFHTLDSVPPTISYIVGTVGAGDSFCAGILYSIYKKLSMDEALKIAAASAAANLSAGDSVGGLRSIEETMKLYDAYSPRKQW